MKRLIVALCLAAVAPAAVAADPAVRAPEYAVKAALLVKFAEMVEWPDSAPSRSTATLNLCTIGEDVFTKEVRQTIAAKTVRGRGVSISHVTRAEQVRDCAVLFITTRGTGVEAMVRRFARLPILTVGEGPAFNAAGGVIAFRQDGDRLRFEVNQQAATAAGLTLDPKLVEAGIR